MEKCFHCGESCIDIEIKHEDKSFCCHGCKTVFEILHDNDLSYYYDLEKTPGISPIEVEGKYNFLDNQNIVEKLLEFNDENTHIVSFLIPSIHCSSCIWILENLNKLNPFIRTSQVNFPEKTIRITYSPQTTSLKEVVILLNRIGYEPYISLDDSTKKEKRKDRSLIYRLGVAGFAFGNVMFLSFPEYFEIKEIWLDEYKYFFRWLMFGYSLPVLLYSSQIYFISAYKGLRSGILNIDVPLALGIAVLFIRSTLDIVMDWGSGFFDSMTGLVFFLLLGKFFQQRTYSYLSFERDYKSYFPIAVTKLIKPELNAVSQEIIEEQTEVYKIITGDRILIRNNEIIPVDSILIKGNALIDYSFVTGEAEPISKQSGDKLFAGGKQQAGVLEVEVLKPVEQSYLTQLWSNDIFSKERFGIFESLTDSISKRFTITILSIAFIATIFWLVVDPSKAFNVFTAVLIVACPCAIALAAPFTLGNLLRIYGKEKLYLKEASVIENMAKVDTVVFDKTGTLTTNQKNEIEYQGVPLTYDEEHLLVNTLRASNHPLSRSLYNVLDSKNGTTHKHQALDYFHEEVGQGIQATLNSSRIKAGSYDFVGSNSNHQLDLKNKTTVHVSKDDVYKGVYIFNSEYREGVSSLFKKLQADGKEIVVLSGDNEGERVRLDSMLPKGVQMYFNQKPDDKLNFIKQLQASDKKVMMIGDGLNDAGALKQSNVGIVISENTNVFSPACDGILDASMFTKIAAYFDIATGGVRIIKWAFILSLFYNLIGVSFAVSGHLRPVVAAILMPLSSISIVAFTTIATRLLGRKKLF